MVCDLDAAGKALDLFDGHGGGVMREPFPQLGLGVLVVHEGRQAVDHFGWLVSVPGDSQSSSDLGFGDLVGSPARSEQEERHRGVSHGRHPRGCDDAVSGSPSPTSTVTTESAAVTAARASSLPTALAP